MAYIVGVVVVLLLTAVLYITLLRIHRMQNVPQISSLPKKVFATLCVLLPAMAVVFLGTLGGMALRQSLGRTSVAYDDSTLLFMVAGLLIPALLIGYIFMASVYTTLFAKTDFSPAQPVRKATKTAGDYKALEAKAYRIFTALFFLSGCFYVYGINN